MCRYIRNLFHSASPASVEEIRAAALQYVRKVSGFAAPPAANEKAFHLAVEEIAQATSRLLDSLLAADRAGTGQAGRARLGPVPRRESPPSGT